VAYYAGHAAADAIGRYGLFGGVVVVVLAIGVFFGLRFWKKRMLRTETES
jgi:hypothetical protein